MSICSLVGWLVVFWEMHANKGFRARVARSLLYTMRPSLLAAPCSGARSTFALLLATHADLHVHPRHGHRVVVPTDDLIKTSEIAGGSAARIPIMEDAACHSNRRKSPGDYSQIIPAVLLCRAPDWLQTCDHVAEEGTADAHQAGLDRQEGVVNERTCSDTVYRPARARDAPC